MLEISKKELNSISGGGWALAMSIASALVWLGGVFVGYITTRKEASRS